MADPERYQSPLTGQQMDQALLDMANHTSERFAKGTANGVAVEAGTDGYNDNSKYYKDQAANQVTLAAAQVTQANNAADRAANAADRAEAAVPAGIDSAVLFTRAQTLTAAQKSQARANIRAGGSNPNLLDNPWFTVNQRGWTSGIASNAYCIDRWKAPFASQALRITVNSDNTITIDRLTSGTAGFYQYLDSKNLDKTKRYTCSIMDSDGNIYSHTVPFPTSQSGERWFTIGTLTVGLGLWAVGGNQNNIAFVLYMSSNANPQTGTIKACKLEEGEYSTLANDVPPNYAEELRKCQYYFKRWGSHTVFRGKAYSANQVHIYVPWTHRDASVSRELTGSLTVYTVTGSSLTFSDVIVNYYDTNQVRLSLGSSSLGLTANTPVMLELGGSLSLSADR